MLQATERCETSHAIPHHFLRATANRMEIPREEAADLAEPSFLPPSFFSSGQLTCLSLATT